MMRNRSRAVTSKQGVMTDHHGSQSSSSSPPTQNYTKPVASLFGSSRFKAFTFKEGEPVMSPTSILDTSNRPFSPFKKPFWNDSNPPKSPKIFAENKHSWDKLDLKGIGVALIDHDTQSHDKEPKKENNSTISSPKLSNRMVLFGTKLKVQIPPLPSASLSTVESPKSPADFGIKTRNISQLSASGSANSGIQTRDSPKVFTGCLSVTEMELSEDYTCVISRGPNPKTTHIFDNCILENYCSLSDKSSSEPKNFHSFCYTCKKNLEQKIDINNYRGEKAFCSHECRYQEMRIHGVEA